jgi:hypothetical protein
MKYLPRVTMQLETHNGLSQTNSAWNIIKTGNAAATHWQYDYMLIIGTEKKALHRPTTFAGLDLSIDALAPFPEHSRQLGSARRTVWLNLRHSE